ncbi:MAG: thymidylate synthase [Candidatus Woesearchaeota archaeon]
MAEIVSSNVIDAWKKSLRYIIDNGTDYNDTKRDFRQVLNFNLIITNPVDDINYPIRFLSESDYWVYPSIDEIKNIILSKDKNPSYDFTYGQRLFNFSNKINQIDDYIIPLLKKDNFTRRGIVIFWDPNVDINTTTDQPGLLLCTFKIVDNKMNVTAIIRNNDFFVGFPATLYQINLLQEYTADKIGVEIGSIIFYSTTAHIYKENINLIENKLLLKK